MTPDEARQRAVEAAAREWLGAAFDDASEECRVDWLREMTAAIHVWEATLWQPIETAPRDGTPVVLIGIYPDGATWSDQLQCWWQWTARPSPVVKHDGQWVRWHHSMETVPPTHWRPLPAWPGDGA